MSGCSERGEISRHSQDNSLDVLQKHRGKKATASPQVPDPRAMITFRKRMQDISSDGEITVNTLMKLAVSYSSLAQTNAYISEHKHPSGSKRVR